MRISPRAPHPHPHPHPRHLIAYHPHEFSTSAASIATPSTSAKSSSSQSSPSSSSSSSSSSPSSSTSSPNTNSLDFDDVSQSFSIKTTPELIRGLIVFHLCGIRPLVTNARRLLNLSEKILGRRITEWILKQTFFGHFCAGQTNEEVAKVIRKLDASGLGGILDYAAEADLSTVPPSQQRDRTGVNSARIYDYEGESECDANALICAQCIEAAGMRQNGQQAFAAIKLTALGKPELLEHLSKILTETKRLFVQFTEASQQHAAATAASSSSTPSSSPSSSSKLPSANNPNPSISVRTKMTFSAFQSGLIASTCISMLVLIMHARCLGLLLMKYSYGSLNLSEMEFGHRAAVQLSCASCVLSKGCGCMICVQKEHTTFSLTLHALLLLCFFFLFLIIDITRMELIDRGFDLNAILRIEIQRSDVVKHCGV